MDKKTVRWGILGCSGIGKSRTIPGMLSCANAEFYALAGRNEEKLKAYANSQGIQIIGDIPIYVAFDSSDAWAEPELFRFDKDRKPTAVAGCPPDAFSATGQLWGNPLYDWEYHKKTGYEWWMRRLAACYQLYDVVRIDHFRAFRSEERRVGKECM